MKKILLAASECVPFIKTGGLADVAGTLPKYFDKENNRELLKGDGISAIIIDENEHEKKVLQEKIVKTVHNLFLRCYNDIID